MGLCETAKDAPYEREITSGVAQRLEADDMARAVSGVRRSVSGKQLARYDKFRNDK